MVLLGPVFLLSVKSRNYYTATGLILAKLYSNSLMAIFNSRIRIVGGRDSDRDFITHVDASRQLTGLSNAAENAELTVMQFQEDIWLHTGGPMTLDDGVRRLFNLRAEK